MLFLQLLATPSQIPQGEISQSSAGQISQTDFKPLDTTADRQRTQNQFQRFISLINRTNHSVTAAGPMNK